MDVLGVSIIVGLYHWSAHLRFGYTFSGMLSQPLGAVLVAGLATGKFSEAMVVGVGTQLIYLGVISMPDGSVPSDLALVSTIVIPIALGVEMNVEATVTLAVPPGMLSVFMDQLRRTISATWVHMTDKYVEELNYGGIYRTALIYPALAGFLTCFPLVFAMNFFGQSVVNKVSEVIPAWLMHDFEIIGGILPALGSALTIMVIGKKNLIPYLLISLVTIVYLGAEAMVVAVLGIYTAFLVRNKVSSEGAT